MSEKNLGYRVFITFCVVMAVGVIVLLAEYMVLGYRLIDISVLWSLVLTGLIVSLVTELIYHKYFPISGHHLKRNVIWRNRIICSIINAFVVVVVGKFVLGGGFSLPILAVISFVFGLIAIVVSNVIIDRIYMRSVREMNRRLSQMNNAIGDSTGGLADTEME